MPKSNHACGQNLTSESLQKDIICSPLRHAHADRQLEGKLRFGGTPSANSPRSQDTNISGGSPSFLEGTPSVISPMSQVINVPGGSPSFLEGTPSVISPMSQVINVPGGSPSFLEGTPSVLEGSLGLFEDKSSLHIDRDVDVTTLDPFVPAVNRLTMPHLPESESVEHTNTASGGGDELRLGMSESGHNVLEQAMEVMRPQRGEGDVSISKSRQKTLTARASTVKRSAGEDQHVGQEHVWLSDIKIRLDETVPVEACSVRSADVDAHGVDFDVRSHAHSVKIDAHSAANITDLHTDSTNFDAQSAANTKCADDVRVDQEQAMPCSDASSDASAFACNIPATSRGSWSESCNRTDVFPHSHAGVSCSHTHTHGAEQQSRASHTVPISADHARANDNHGDYDGISASSVDHLARAGAYMDEKSPVISTDNSCAHRHDYATGNSGKETNAESEQQSIAGQRDVRRTSVLATAMEVDEVVIDAKRHAAALALRMRNAVSDVPDSVSESCNVDNTGRGSVPARQLHFGTLGEQKGIQGTAQGRARVCPNAPAGIPAGVQSGGAEMEDNNVPVPESGSDATKNSLLLPSVNETTVRVLDAKADTLETETDTKDACCVKSSLENAFTDVRSCREDAFTDVRSCSDVVLDHGSFDERGAVTGKGANYVVAP
jgi:hypothetical protein